MPVVEMTFNKNMKWTLNVAQSMHDDGDSHDDDDEAR